MQVTIYIGGEKMGTVSVDINEVFHAISNIKVAIDSIENTKNGIQGHYQQLGESWNDKKYKELGDIVVDCRSALNTILKTLLQGEKYLLNIYQALKDYESVNFSSSISGVASRNTNASLDANPDVQTKQNIHRDLIISRDGQIDGIIDDVKRGSGQDIDRVTASVMLDSLHNYSGDGYSEIRYAYNNPDASLNLTNQLNSVDEYVRSAPKWEGTVYRGINVSRSIAQNILSNNTVDMLGPSSWSSDEDVAQRFSYGSDSISMVFVLNDNISGASITHFARYNGSESEVLAPSGVQYSIDNVREVTQDGRTFIYVDVHEI